MPRYPGIALLSLALWACHAWGAEEAALPDLGWGLAPLRWRGLLAADLRQFRSEGQPSRLHRVESGQVQVSSYVWQPWFAQVQGGIGVVSSRERSDNASRSTSLTGNGLLSLFPASRFPFQANLDVSDSRTADQFSGQTYQSTRYGVRQTHRSLSGGETSAASYNHSTLTSSSFGRDRLDTLNASHSRRLGPHGLDGNADFTRNEREGSDEHARYRRLFARHGWSEGVSTVDTSVSYGESDLQLSSAGAPAATRTEFFQVNNFFTWRRDEDDPLSVTGGVRYFQNVTESAATSAETRSTMGYANGNYRYNRNLLFNAGAAATEAQSGGTSNVITTQSAGVSYAADARRLGTYLYTVNLGANVLNQNGGDAERRIESGQAGHNLQRNFEPGPAQSVTANLSQTFAASHDSVAGSLRTVTHNASLMWRATQGPALTSLVGASAADSRTHGHTDSTFQLVNAQASGQAQFDRTSALIGNITVQGTRQATAPAPLGGFNTNINGGLTYQHLRAFGVPRLRYRATYERNDYRLNTRLQGDLDATREHTAWSLEQRLEYRIGKLEARTSLRFAEVDGKETALLFFRLARELGD